nr:hypothetical protein [Rhizobium leguminosarum]
MKIANTPLGRSHEFCDGAQMWVRRAFGDNLSDEQALFVMGGHLAQKSLIVCWIPAEPWEFPI